jgi:hypothetical protein
MNLKEILENPQFSELLASIPEKEREKVVSSIEELITEFNDKILKPLERAKK